LGWVRYRTGDWRASIEALEKSCQLESGGDCAQWIVLALAHARIAGQKDLPAKEREQHQSQARRWYDQAVKQIDRWRAPPGDATGQAIWDFRAEARGLMGVKDGCESFPWVTLCCATLGLVPETVPEFRAADVEGPQGGDRGGAFFDPAHA
jgi:hypothetical protein